MGLERKGEEGKDLEEEGGHGGGGGLDGGVWGFWWELHTKHKIPFHYIPNSISKFIPFLSISIPLYQMLP